MQQPETFSDYVRQFVEDRDIITTTKTHIDLAGDLSAGAVLEELVFWSAPNKNGQAKLRVKKDGKLWLAVPREEWWERRRLSPKQADRAIKILVGLGLVEKATYKFAGSPVVHICINEEGFMAALAKYRECKPASEGYKGRYRPEKPDSEGAESPFFPKGEIPFSPKGEIHFPQAGRTYTVSTSVPTLQPLKEKENNLSTHFGVPQAGDFQLDENTEFILVNAQAETQDTGGDAPVEDSPSPDATDEGVGADSVEGTGEDTNRQEMPNAAAPGRNGGRNEATAGVFPTPQNRSVGKEQSAFIDSYLQAREGQPSGAVNGQVGYDDPDVTRLELYILARHDRDWMAKEVSDELRTGGWHFDNNRQYSVAELFETDSVFGDWVDSLFDQYEKKLNEIWRRIVHPKLGARSFYEDRGASPLPTTTMPVDVVPEDDELYNSYVKPAAQLEVYLAKCYDQTELITRFCRMLRKGGWRYPDETFYSYNNRFEWDYAFRTYVKYLVRRYKTYHGVVEKIARYTESKFYSLYFRIWDRICDFLSWEYPEDIDDLYIAGLVEYLERCLKKGITDKNVIIPHVEAYLGEDFNSIPLPDID